MIPRTSRTLIAAGCSILLIAATTPVFATESATANVAVKISENLEPQTANGRQIYEASQFARFAPQTALDMVSQIPGFQISQVSADRGLGEANQNVLINGQRITGKSNDARTALSRLPVSSVTRLEIADGATFNINGLVGQVLNVVTKSDALQGNFAWRPSFQSHTEANLLNGEVNLSGKLGKGDFTLGTSNNAAYRIAGVGNDVIRDGNGNLLQVREQLVQRQVDQPRIAGTYSFTSSGGSIFNANAALEFYESRLYRPYDVTAVGQPDFRELRTSREDEWNIELGADYEFGLGNGRLKLIGFQRYEHSPFSNYYRRDFTTGAPSVGQRFDQTIDEGESVARAEYRWKSVQADWQISAEGAYNFLDSEAALFQLDSQGGLNPVSVPNANSRVEEKRGQLLLSYGRPLSPSLSLQSTIGGEYSQIKQSGPNGLSRQFFRPKGFVTLAWNASPRLSISTKLERKVHQLNFFDFIASVDVQNSNDNAGNPMLVPPQSWLLNFEANRSLGAAGSIKLKIDAEAISDIVDRVPIGPTQEAPGNLPSAKRLRGEIIGSFVLDAIGFKGAKLDATLALQTASLRDPLTGEKRPISDRGRSYWRADFRHDVPGSDWAWGLSAEDSNQYGFYRLDYFGRDFQSGPLTSAFVEHKDVFGLKVRAQLSNLTSQNRQYREIFYVDRRDGPIDFTRDGKFGAELTYSLSVSGTF